MNDRVIAIRCSQKQYDELTACLMHLQIECKMGVGVSLKINKSEFCRNIIFAKVKKIMEMCKK